MASRMIIMWKRQSTSSATSLAVARLAGRRAHQRPQLQQQEQQQLHTAAAVGGAWSLWSGNSVFEKNNKDNLNNSDNNVTHAATTALGNFSWYNPQQQQRQLHAPSQPRRRYLSSISTPSSSSSSYAVVHHGQAYEASLQGFHGRQLDLAVQIEAQGKDDAVFDPFVDDDDDDPFGDDPFGDDDEEDKALLEQQVQQLSESSDSTTNSTNNDSSANELEDDDDDDEVIELDHDEMAEMYAVEPSFNNDGSQLWTRGQLTAFRAGAPAGGLFAVVELAGSQFKVTADDVVVVNKIPNWEVGSMHTLHDVLLVGSSHYTLVGLPYVTGSRVRVLVEEITKDAKVIIFHKRRRKHSQRKRGFRRQVTLLRILSVEAPAAQEELDYVPRIPPGDETVSLLATANATVETTTSTASDEELAAA